MGPGWGAGQNMWYMQELNQFLAQMLLPSQDAAAVPGRRQLHFEQLLRVTDTTLQAKRQTQRAALSLKRQAKRQTRRAALSVKRPAARTLLQEAAESTVQEPEMADLAASEPILPLADEVGEIYMYTADDTRAIAPLWWNYTKQMRVFHETHAQVRWSFYLFRTCCSACAQNGPVNQSEHTCLHGACFNITCQGDVRCTLEKTYQAWHAQQSLNTSSQSTQAWPKEDIKYSWVGRHDCFDHSITRQPSFVAAQTLKADDTARMQSIMVARGHNITDIPCLNHNAVPMQYHCTTTTTTTIYTTTPIIS